MTTALFAFAALALHVAGLFAAMHALMNTRTAPGAVAWVLGLVVLPYVTLVPHLFLGSSRFKGYTDMHRQRRRDGPMELRGTHATAFSIAIRRIRPVRGTRRSGRCSTQHSMGTIDCIC